MNIATLQRRGGEWARAYRTKKERHPGFLFAHAHEEVSEAWKAWREGDTELRYEKVRKHGTKIQKPEGLGAELADAAILIAIIAEEMKIDLDEAIENKFVYLDARLEAKRNKRGPS